jgi:hypothetical protein
MAKPIPTAPTTRRTSAPTTKGARDVFGSTVDDEAGDALTAPLVVVWAAAKGAVASPCAVAWASVEGPMACAGRGPPVTLTTRSIEMRARAGATSASAETSSPTPANRAFRSFRRQRSTTARSEVGNDGRRLPSGTGSSSITLVMVFGMSSPTNGSLPDSSSYKITPRRHPLKNPNQVDA